MMFFKIMPMINQRQTAAKPHLKRSAAWNPASRRTLRKEYDCWTQSHALRPIALQDSQMTIWGTWLVHGQMRRTRLGKLERRMGQASVI